MKEQRDSTNKQLPRPMVIDFASMLGFPGEPDTDQNPRKEAKIERKNER